MDEKEIKEWEEGFEKGYNFCKMLSEVKSYKGIFWPDDERKGLFRNGFAEGTITGSHLFNVHWKWVDDGNGTTTWIEKICNYQGNY